LPGRRTDHADKQAIDDHHTNGPNPSRDAQSKRREAYGKVVGHNARSGQRLDRYDGLRPHLPLLDGLHHPWAKHAMREGWIMNGHGPGGDSRYGENKKSQQGLPKRFPENLRKSVRVETDKPAHFLLVAHVDEIVGPSKKLIEVVG